MTQTQSDTVTLTQEEFDHLYDASTALWMLLLGEDGPTDEGRALIALRARKVSALHKHGQSIREDAIAARLHQLYADLRDAAASVSA